MIGKNSSACASQVLRWMPPRRTKSMRSSQLIWKTRTKDFAVKVCLKQKQQVGLLGKFQTGRICSGAFLSQRGEEISCRNVCTSFGFPGSLR